MPNWCGQDLLISGEKEELTKFKKFAKTKFSVLDSEKFIPYPEKFKELSKVAKEREQVREPLFRKVRESETLTEKEKEKKYKELEEKYPYIKDGFNQGGYEWCCENWGSKWGICSAGLTEEKDKMLVYGFESAWGPVIPLIIKMSELFPTLTFKLRYSEMGMGFKGKFYIKNKIVLKDENTSYN